MQEESVHLRCKQGSSNKVYNAELVQTIDGWMVNYSFGPYGKPLRAGSKTRNPEDYDKAKKIYDTLVRSKTSKGYSPEGEGVAFVGTEHAGRVTGYQPQLLNAVTLEDMIDLIKSEPDMWLVQEKFDGERRGLKVENGKVTGSNRKGLDIPLRKTIQDAVKKLVEQGFEDFEIDCEDMGEWMAPFDMLRIEGIDLRDYEFGNRLMYLDDFNEKCKIAGVDHIFRKVLTVKIDNPDMVAGLAEDYRRNKSEGLVFKLVDATYEAGRPNSGGTHLKLKFTNDITVRVAAQSDGKRSVAMEMLHEGVWTGIGNVTIPPNQKIPDVGALVDINYLYAYPGGSLYQPVFRGEREDYRAEDCTTDRLVYKGNTGIDVEQVAEPDVEPGTGDDSPEF